MNVDVPVHDARRIEVVCNGLPLWHGVQLAVDATLVSTLVSPVKPSGLHGSRVQTKSAKSQREACCSWWLGGQPVRLQGPRALRGSSLRPCNWPRHARKHTVVQQ